MAPKFSVKLGAGSYGSVYVNSNPNRPGGPKLVATKAMGGDLLSTFISEVAITNSLGKHRNVIDVLSAYRYKDWLMYDMPMMACDLGSRTHLTGQQALQLAADISAGLAHIHSCGYVHADLKPQNVLIAQDGRAVISDFGLAHPSSIWPDWHVQSGQYRAPENCEDESKDIFVRQQYGGYASDVWSMGITLLSMLGHDVVAASNLAGSIDSWRNGILQVKTVMERLAYVKINRYKGIDAYALTSLVNIAFDCLLKDPKLRPSAFVVHNMIAELARQIGMDADMIFAENILGPKPCARVYRETKDIARAAENMSLELVHRHSKIRMIERKCISYCIYKVDCVLDDDDEMLARTSSLTDILEML